jgi:predicted ATPase
MARSLPGRPRHVASPTTCDTALTTMRELGPTGAWSGLIRERTVDGTRGLLVLRAENFLSLRDVEVQLSRVNVLVGPNGSGKSNFLDAIRFLGDSVRLDLGPAIDIRGGYRRLRFRGHQTGAIQLTIEANVTKYSNVNARDVYRLRFYEGRSGRPSTFLRRNEAFRFKRYRGPGRRIEISGSEVIFSLEDEEEQVVSRTPDSIKLRSDSLALSTLPRLAPEAGGEQITQIAEMFATFRVFDVDVAAIRNVQLGQESDQLRDDASNLSQFLYRLAQDYSDLFSRLVEDVREICPGLKSLDFQPVGPNEDDVALVLQEFNFSQPTLLHEASFGTVRGIALLALLYDPEPPLITCVEEIDHGLHPYALDVVVDRLREASQRTQFIAATHSPALVNRLKAEELIVCERDLRTGASRIPATSPDTVLKIEEAVEGELGLGEIWFTGTIGGVPR